VDNWLPQIVRAGEHTSGLAYRHGCTASDVWEHPKNEELKRVRANPDVLRPGDLIWLPEAPLRKSYPIAPGDKLTITVSVPKVPVTIFLCDREHKPLSGLAYQVVGLAGDVKGTSGSDGKVSFMVPVTLKEVELYLPERDQRIPMLIGALDPENTVSGAIARLNNLEFYDYGDRSAEQEQEYRAHCLEQFQKRFGIPVTREFDETTMKKIAEVGGRDV
jgi:N-acetylmuramoyl-L-alanine amidase